LPLHPTAFEKAGETFIPRVLRTVDPYERHRNEA